MNSVIHSTARTGARTVRCRPETASGGGAIEKAVYATRTTDYGTGGKPEKMGVKGVQFSIDGAVGADFRIARSMGLYLETGAAYYFEGENESTYFGTFTSYRTDNPVNFTLRIGIRFNIMDPNRRKLRL